MSRSKLPTPPAAARHQECALIQSTDDEGRQYALHISTGLRDDLNPGRRNSHLQGPGDRAADQHVAPCFGQPRRARLGLIHIKGHVLSALLDTAIDLNDQHVPGHVEHRTDSTSPVGYRDLHDVKTLVKSRANLIALT